MADESGAGTSLVERIKRILLEPNQEWDRIDAEPMTVKEIFTKWVLILAVIPVVATLVGLLVFARSNGFLGGFGLSLSVLITNAVLLYIFTASGLFLFGLLIDALAPTFNGTQNRVQAMKLAAFSATPTFLSGIFGLLPPLAVLLTLIGTLYALYLLYLGLPKLMKVPEDKAVPYMVAVIVAGLVLVIIAYAVMAAISGLMAPSYAPLVGY